MSAAPEAAAPAAPAGPKPKKSVALSGVTAGNTALCTVGRTGNDLHYRGYDILDVAENFLEFFVEESCGQCTPCRLGNPQMPRAVELLKEGACPPEFLASVKALGETMKVASKCGLGQTSPSAFLSILEGFDDEIANRAVSA